VPFDPAYIRLVLQENFDDAKATLLEPLLAVHHAHLVMLAEQGILSRDDARAIRDALDAIDLAAIEASVYDGSTEDLFFHVERLLAATCGEAVAGRLHTARSRNDIDMTMYRIKLREWLLGALDATVILRRVLLALAGRHVTTVFPAHTHTQPAQPTTLAHYLLGAIEELERHTTRLLAAYRTVNLCPLGACAITGTSFPIDRARTSHLLGFAAPTGNTYGSIATVDYVIESAGAVANLLVGVGRLIQDLLLWSTSEVGFLRLADGFVQTSSIMPQKRNPVALEHARALASKALGQAGAIPVAVHNTPFGDIVDTEDDLQPLVAAVFKDAARAVRLVAAAMGSAEFDVARMRARAGEGWITLTDLADVLARDHGLAFSQAHAVAGAVMQARATAPSAKLSDLVAATSRVTAGREIRIPEDQLATILSPDHFVEVRQTPGGPAPGVVTAALSAAASTTAADGRKVHDIRNELMSAEARRRQAADEL
jgi:argininosuccinate lyase